MAPWTAGWWEGPWEPAVGLGFQFLMLQACSKKVLTSSQEAGGRGVRLSSC